MNKETKKIKILHIIPNIGIGGAEEVLKLICKYSDKKKNDAVVCTLEKEMSKGYYADTRGCGINVITCSMDNINASKKNLRFLINFFVTFKKVLRLIKSIKPHIIHTHMFWAGLFGRSAGMLYNLTRKSKVLLVHHEQATIDRENFSFFHIYVDWLLSKYNKKIICCSEAVKKSVARIEKIPVSKFIVIKNCSDIERFVKAKKTHYSFIKKGDYVVGCVARLSKQKGHKYLLLAVKKLSSKIPNLKVLLIGKGPLKKELKKMVYELGIYNHVLFLGTREDVPQLMKNMDVFVLPSLWEGLGVVVEEAMAAGVPVVASGVEGINEIVQDKVTGLLIKPGDPDAIAEAVLKLYKDKNLAKMLCNQRNIEQFSPEFYTRKLESIYYKLLDF